MPNWIHRTTLNTLRSVASADLPEPEANYIQDPVLPVVEPKYWKIVGDAVFEMDAGEKAAVDSADQNARRLRNRARAVAAPDTSSLAEENFVIDGVQLRELIELFNRRDNYLVNRIIQLQEDLQAIKASNGPADNIRAAIRGSYLPTATRTRAEAIQTYKDEINAGDAD
jgi:hypothetical protein